MVFLVGMNLGVDRQHVATSSHCGLIEQLCRVSSKGTDYSRRGCNRPPHSGRAETNPSTPTARQNFFRGELADTDHLKAVIRIGDDEAIFAEDIEDGKAIQCEAAGSFRYLPVLPSKRFGHVPGRNTSCGQNCRRQRSRVNRRHKGRQRPDRPASPRHMAEMKIAPALVNRRRPR